MPTLIEALDQATSRYGRAPALIARQGIRTLRWSYVDLQTDSVRAAALLAARGVGRGDRVAIWAPNSPEWVIILFACWRRGAVAVPLDPAPINSIRRRIEKVCPRLIVTTRQLADHLPAGTRCLLVEDVLAALPDSMDTAESVAPDSRLPAVIVFGSRLDARTDAISLTHASLLENASAFADCLSLPPRSRFLSLLPLSQTFEQIAGLLVPLLAGGTVVYPTGRRPSRVFRSLRENRVTHLVVVPDMMRSLMAALEREAKRQHRQVSWDVRSQVAAVLPARWRHFLFGAVHRQFGGRLRMLVCGGVIPPALSGQWERLGIPVATGYTVGDSGPIIACGAPGERRPGSIGRVLSGQEVRIADDGEILVRPAHDAHKVWRDAVTPDSTSGVDWYHTGDLGEWVRDTLIVRGSKRPEVDLPLLSPAMTNSHDPARVTESQGVADTLPRRVASGSLVATRAIDAAPNPDGSPFDVEAGDCADRRRAPGVGGASRTENPPPSWPRQLPARLARAVLQATVIPAIVHSGYTLRVAGLEILDSLAGPVIFAANHHWHLDTGFILATLPHRWRRHLAIAAAADDIFGSPLNSLLAGLVGNGFPVARDRAIRANLDHIGRLLDDGWSILIYPEGRLTPGGPPQSFKAGTGLVAVESGTTVVPVYVDVCRPGWREGAWQRGLATVRIGSPVHFKRGTDHQAATHQIEDAVCRLASLPVESELALR